MTAQSPSLTVIVPIGPGDLTWRNLLGDLQHWNKDFEVLLASTTDPSADERQFIKQFSYPVVWQVSSKMGRAEQQNQAARTARATWLFFLHADSRLSPEVQTKTWETIEGNKAGLYFFQLAFQATGKSDFDRQMNFTAWGANQRSVKLAIPFGDQGFLMPQYLFWQAGPFPADLPYGEDHVLAWRIRAMAYPLSILDAKIYTSARKYLEKGWHRTSWQHWILTLLQALPEARRWAVTRARSWRMKRGAVAVFVKTPSYSSLKTRLAESIGKELAEEFHQRSCRVIEETMLAAQKNWSLDAYWAVAEESAMAAPLWSRLRRIHQGGGDLADRLDHIYSQLIEKYDYVILLGADSPQLTMRELEKAVKIHSGQWILGPAADGGFYLFAGAAKLTKKFWKGIEYSHSGTAAQLSQQLLEMQLGSLTVLEQILRDVDTVQDLQALTKLLQNHDQSEPVWSKAQIELGKWLQDLKPAMLAEKHLLSQAEK